MMAAAIVSPKNPNILPENAEADETEDSDIDNQNQKKVIETEKVLDGSITNNNNLHVPALQQNDEADTSTAHTDSENDEEEEVKKPKHIQIKDPRGDANTKDPASSKELAAPALIDPQEDNTEVLLAAKERFSRPPTPRSPRRSLPSSAKKKLKGSCDEEETSSDDDDNDNICSDHRKESYVQLRLRRKTLLKIEKFTDSDSRSREKMRRRALSPPTSSDEENLHIGWVAYPASVSSPHIQNERRRSYHGQHVACACAQALKCIFSPVTKVCKKCRVNNKVWDSESLHEKLIDNAPEEEVGREERRPSN